MNRSHQFHLRAAALILLALAAGCARSPLVTHEYEDAELRRLALDSYDEGLRFAEAGNNDLALERFDRALAISPRPAASFQKAKLLAVKGRKGEAAIAYADALGQSPDYQEARIGLMELGLTPPSESEMTTDTLAYERFTEKVGLEAEVWKAEAEQGGKNMTPEEREALRLQVRKDMTSASEKRLPTPAEVKAAIFPAGGPVQEEAMPSPDIHTFGPDRDIILNTYAYHFANGQRFQKNKEYDKAAGEYRIALQADPDKIEAKLNLGDCMLRLERYPQAQHHYLTAIEQFPESAKPLFKMGNYYESLGKIPLARSYYEQALGKDANFLEALNNLGALEIREKNNDKAIEYMRRVLAIEPDYTLALLNLGVAQEAKGDKAGALKSYRRYIELGGERADEVSGWVSELQ